MTSTHTITHPELVAALLKPGKEIAEQMTAQEADLWHNATGVSGEAGEILQCVFSSHLNDCELDVENMVEELGDMAFYLEGLRQNVGLSREETLTYVGQYRKLSLLDETIMLSIASANLLDLVKKTVIYKKVLDPKALVMALSSIERSLEEIRNHIGVDRPFVLGQNIDKLSVRYAGLTYTNEAAQVRADKPQGE